MQQLQEGDLSFTFDNDWVALKYDAESGFYKQTIDCMSLGVKAVDLLACDNQRQVWIEVKDFSGYEADNECRLSGNDPESLKQAREWAKEKGFEKELSISRKKPYIVEEFALKVINTFAGICIARQLEDMSLSAFYASCQPVTVVLLLSLKHNPRDYGRLAGRLRQKLVNRLKPLQVNILVCNEHTVPPHAGWTVRRA